MSLVKKIGREVDKNAPVLLSVVGTGGFISSIFMAVRATPPAKQALDKKGPDITTGERIRILLPYYAPTIGMVAISTACIIGSSNMSSYRYAALTSVFVSGQESMVRLQKAIVETVGAKKAEAIQQAADNPPPSQLLIVSDGSVSCWDSYSSRPFTLNRVEDLQSAVNNINQIVFRDGFASVNELYIELGMDTIQYGDDIGWSVESGGCIIRIGAMLTKEQKPCVTLGFATVPKHFMGHYG